MRILVNIINFYKTTFYVHLEKNTLNMSKNKNKYGKNGISLENLLINYRNIIF